jgi:amino acid adenylation domain-containing protein
MHQSFETQAQRTPERTAVKAGAQTLSYGALEGRANRIARTLRARGIGRGQRVGLCLERGTDMLAALLGVLKSGAAYVPLDPAFPAERLRFMAEDADLSLLLCTAALASESTVARERQLRLDEDAAQLAAHSEDRLAPDTQLDAGGEDPAYVIYTSGSTGRPKGVIVPHRAVVNLLVSMAREPGLGPQDVLLAVTTLSFDIAVLELQLPLAVGATVVIASRDEAMDGRALAAQLERHQVSVMQATPVTWRLLLEAGWKAARRFKALIGGEALPRDLAEELLAQDIELWNMYGPTETTVWSTCYRVRDARDIHIGGPIANTEICILDEHGQQAPAGVEGELLIGGAGVALGYWKRPELTAEKFIPHPSVRGATLYRTGDIARRRPDGNIDCLGRMDFQVKIRGYRIELGEIEALLSRHPNVRESVVADYEDSPGNRRLVAYLVTRDAGTIEPDELRALLRARLPEYMIPAAFVTLAEIPRTNNGKTDRKALPAPVAAAQPPASAAARPGSPMEESLAAIWREVLGVAQVGRNTNFFDLGGHSLLVGRVHLRLQKLLDRPVSIVDLYQHPTISKLAAFLSGSAGSPVPARKGAAPRTLQADDAIAIIGMAGRFPGADDLNQFWANLENGVESISFFSAAQLQAAGVPQALIANPDYVPAKAIVDKADYFDARFFGYSPGEATLMDPQQRIFLEAAWSALEDAGCDPDQYTGSIGVYAGASPNLYMFQVLGVQQDNLTGYGFPLTIHQEKDYLATRVSYEMNLRGPSVAVQTACSTSLVAVHMACRSLLGGECDIALSGAVSVQVPQHSGYLYQQGGIGSRDGHCRVFDAAASGTVFGNGVGVVVLKRLSDALRDGDPIRAVIRSTAINNDGSGKAGFTAPSVAGQAEVITMAHRAAAQLNARRISYVEAHGTGTVVGDPIEITALTQAFRATTPDSGFCALGSVKSNIGHLDAAAGMAGLIKTVLALEHRRIPPTVNFSSANPDIDFAHSPFYVNTQLADWKSDGPRLAGVSSFGVGGTNAHLILEEAPPPPTAAASSLPQLLVFSAGTPAALDASIANVREHLRANPALDLAEVAYTLQRGRHAFELRQTFVGENSAESLQLLDPAARPPATRSPQSVPKIVFMFTGQGSQYAGMGAELYRSEAEFRRCIDECLELIRPHVDADLRTILWAQSGQQDAGLINQTAYTQPALFIVEYALARLWMHWGVTPYVMIGHSIGEYVAACLAGVMSLPDALQLVAVRGRLMQGLAPGAMLAAMLAREDVEALIGRTKLQGSLSIAAVNAPELTVVSGPAAAIDAFEAALIGAGQSGRRLHTSHAFHSSMMDPILAEFTRAVARVTLRAPRIPYVSNLTGTWTTDAEATDPGYYANHLRQAVRFSDGIRTIAAEVSPVFLEVGPGQTLRSLARRHTIDGREVIALHSLPAATDKPGDRRAMQDALGQLWRQGIGPDWQALHAPHAPRRVSLPTYPFERRRYAVPSVPPTARSSLAGAARKPIDQWFYAPTWKSSPPAPPALQEAAPAPPPCLVFRDQHPFHSRLCDQLRTAGFRVCEVYAGSAFGSAAQDTFAIDPAAPGDYARLLAELRQQGAATPGLILHLWGLGESGPGPTGAEDAAIGLQFFALLYLAQALGAQESTVPVDIKVLVDGSADVVDEPVTRPQGALAMGPCIVIPQEFDHISASCIDIDLSFADESHRQRLLHQLMAEFSRKSSESLVAYRGRSRWVRSFDALRLPATPAPPPVLKPRGVYLITGGLGGVGLELAEYLGRTVQAKLVLLGRGHFPQQDAWDEWLAGHPADDPTSRRIARLRQLIAGGAEILLCSADVADPAAMRAVLQEADAKFGAINGAIHAAGIAGDGAIQRKSHAAALAVLRAKVNGTRVLGELLAQQGADFLLLCSSVNAIVGGFGQVDYCAANAYLDAFAHSFTASSGMATRSVNWDMWRDAGMGLDASVPEHLRAQRARELQEGITAQEGQDVFARLLGCALPQVLVSTHDFSASLPLQHSAVPDTAEPGEPAAAAPEEAAALHHPRPDLTTAYVAPADEFEQTVTGIWQKALGIDKVGINDNFFELGGDSLLAVRVVGEIRRAVNVSLPVAGFYADPTVASLKKTLQGSSLRAAEASTAEAASADARREARQGLAARGQRRRGMAADNVTSGNDER